MKRLALTAAVLGAAALMIAAAGLAKGPPVAVTIESHVDFDTGLGTFTATGPICPSGTSIDLPVTLFHGYQSNRLVNLQITKVFTCDDGSGSFTLELQVHLKFVPTYSNAATWIVTDGTGRYARMTASGSLVGVLGSNDDIFDTYTGKAILG